ncbi:hypothetical protein Tco_0098494 [Tanacetum coccineum]
MRSSDLIDFGVAKVEATLKSAWIEKDQIDNLLIERRLMRSLEKFVGMIKEKSEKKGIMPTEMELTLEQTQQGVSYEVSYDESNTYVLEKFNTTAGNPVKKILLKLNLSDHRSILTDLQDTYRMVGKRVTVNKMARFIKIATRLRLVDDLKMLKITFYHTNQDKGTSSSLKSNITTSYSQDKKKKEVCEHKNEDLHSMIVYIPEFSSSIPTVREDSSVEEVMTLTKKPAKRRNKRTVQNDEEVWCIPWTIEEEIALCKGYRSLDWSTPRKDDGDETGDQDESVVTLVSI